MIGITVNPIPLLGKNLYESHVSTRRQRCSCNKKKSKKNHTSAFLNEFM